MSKARAVAAALAALFGIGGIAWLLSIGVAEAAVDSEHGGLAASIRRGNSQALGQAAEQAWRSGQADKATELAKRAVAASPINAQAIRTLAQAITVKQPTASAHLMLISAELGWRDPLTQIWLIQQAIGARKPEIAVRRAEALVRLDYHPDIVAMLLRVLAMDEKGRSTMVASLAKDPVWRDVFLTHQENIPPQQLSGVVSILADLSRTAVPPRPAEARPTLEALVQEGQVEQAYKLHRLLFERGRDVLVSNPGFERRDVGYEVNSSASPFDWILLNVGRSSAAIETDPLQGRILDVTAAGEIEGRVAEQLVVLQPGSYDLSYRIRSSDPQAGERVRWFVRCAAGTPILFTQPAARLTSDGWTVRHHRFDVRGECPAQTLELRADPGLGAAPIEVQFDDVQLRRLG